MKSKISLGIIILGMIGLVGCSSTKGDVDSIDESKFGTVEKIGEIPEGYSSIYRFTDKDTGKQYIIVNKDRIDGGLSIIEESKEVE